MHTYTHIHTYMYICIHTHTYIHTYICIYAQTFMHTHTHTQTLLDIHAYIHTHIHTRIHIYIYMYTYICIYADAPGHGIRTRTPRIRARHVIALQALLRRSCTSQRLRRHRRLPAVAESRRRLLQLRVAQQPRRGVQVPQQLDDLQLHGV